MNFYNRRPWYLLEALMMELNTLSKFGKVRKKTKIRNRYNKVPQEASMRAKQYLF